MFFFVSFLLLALAGKTFAGTPSINSISPDNGQNDNDINITIDGEGFDASSRVYIGPGDSCVISTMDTPDYAIDVYALNNYAYVADRNSGLQIIDISDQENPVIAGNYDTSGWASGLYVTGDHVYIAYGNSGLQIVNVRDKENPKLAGELKTPEYASDVYVSGNYAYIADKDSGLQIADVSDPTNPVIIGNVKTPGLASGIYISGNYAYVADWAKGLQIIDVTDPTKPFITGGIDISGYSRRVDVFGKYAYLVNDILGMEIIDISNPAEPIRINTLQTYGKAYDIYVSGIYAYIANLELKSIQVIDISDPEDCRIVSEVDFPGAVSGLYIYGNLALVANSYYGLQIIHRSSAGVIAKPVSIVDPKRITTSIPMRLRPGDYDIKVVNSSNNIAVHYNSFEVTKSISQLKPAGNIDTGSSGSQERVDGHDLYIMARAFGSEPGDSNWNVNADLDKNSVIDGDDFILLVNDFGYLTEQ